jgi:spore germination protein YaaH
MPSAFRHFPKSSFQPSVVEIFESAVNMNPTQHMKNNENILPGLDVLNTGYGDFELRFDPNKPDEVQKAKETITDMLKRGYAIFVQQGQETFRVRKFDVNKNVYIIGSTPAEEVPIADTRAIAVGRSAGG